jgi:hypothetical protein
MRVCLEKDPEMGAVILFRGVERAVCEARCQFSVHHGVATSP